MTTSSYFGLLAEFGTADIPLSSVALKYFGITDREAKRRASMNRLPIPCYRSGSQKSPWLVSAADLSNHIDKAREIARREWLKSQGVA